MGSLPRSPFAYNRADCLYYPAASAEIVRLGGLACLGDGEAGVYLSGPSGAGKSTLLQQILKSSSLPQELLIVNTGLPLTRKELLQSLLFDCRLPLDGAEIELHLRLLDHFAEVLGAGRSIWIKVDGAECLGSGCLAELFGFTKVSGNNGACIQVLLAGQPARQAGDSEKEFCPFPIVEVQPWGLEELADFLRFRAGAVLGHLESSADRKLMATLVPDGKGYPGLVLATLRHAWRLAGNHETIFPSIEQVLQAQALTSQTAQYKSSREARWPLPKGAGFSFENEPLSPSELDHAGLDDWMTGSVISALELE